MNNSSLREGWITVIILLAMGLVLAWTLQAAGVAEGIHVLQIVVLAGTLAGIALARADVPDLVAHGAGLILGAGTAFFSTASLLPSEMSWIERFQSIQLRIADWTQQAVSGGESYDTLMFVLFTACLFWLFTYLGSYAVFRLRMPWLAIIPNGVVIMMNAYYNPDLLAFFVSYLLLSLLLVLRYALFEREDEWRRERVRYNPDVVLDFLRDGALSAFVVIGLAWFFPLTTADYRDWGVWKFFDDPWQEIQFHYNRVFASLSGYGQPQFSFFADSLQLGGAVELGERVVMTVRSPQPLYWRALVFDEYTGRGWVNNDPEELELDPNADSPSYMPYDERTRVSQTMRMFRMGERVIFGANQIVEVGVPTNARLSLLPAIVEGDPEVGARSVAEVSIWGAQTRFRRDDVYTVTSRTSTAPPSVLREAGTDYPAWVTDRYLQLPESLPQRVYDYAEENSGDADNVYDIATSLEAYLHQIPYNEAIPAPPAGVDVVEWFLYEKQEGYCDYYSTAMVVLLRTLGIPARVARGYATGEWDEEGEFYTVRELDAHAWPEVYFPRYGWIEFEPTASEEAIERPPDPGGAETPRIPGGVGGSFIDELPDEDPNDVVPNRPGGPFPTPVPETRWYERTDWLINLLPVAFLALGAWLIMRIRRSRMSPATLVTSAFDSMLRYARRLGIELRPDQTPYECARALAAVMTEGSEDVWAIADLYVKHLYSPNEANVYDEMNAMDAWRRLKQTLRVLWLLKLLPLKSEAADRLRSAVQASG